MSVVYLYGFVPPSPGLPEDGLLGVGDAVVELVDLDGFAAAVGRLDTAAYGEQALEERTSDMEWMAEQGLRHEQVVAWFVDHAAIVPSRLLTLFSSDAALRDMVAGREQRIASELRRFAAAREWDLKVGYDPLRLGKRLGEISEEVADLDAEITRATPGKRFLLERKRKDLARTESRTAARRSASDLLESLREKVEDVSLLPLPEQGTPVVLNAALLVSREREQEVRADVSQREARLADLGFTVSFTGPWAPYRFVEADDD
ncbi:MAG TPA: GvpL/GvpF family gas vesicle protein [Longimicrobiales bacterium]|nr:GvpL/GvpF family gas vesicle protein [Longimicrobiales bacterium]